MAEGRCSHSHVGGFLWFRDGSALYWAIFILNKAEHQPSRLGELKGSFVPSKAGVPHAQLHICTMCRATGQILGSWWDLLGSKASELPVLVFPEAALWCPELPSGA